MTKRAGQASPPTTDERPKRRRSDGRGGTATAPAASRPLRVLVVDDDRVDRIALTRALGQTGFDVTSDEADGVIAAIDLLAGGSSFDCVLLDYNLPDGDGLTFLRGLRGAGISVTVIMITGQQDADVATELVEAGASDYIPKALFTPGLLAQTLARLFGNP
jgi:CheY-like chemotaxis protein